jgi:quercetin dioxygenase-like cupin family protein
MTGRPRAVREQQELPQVTYVRAADRIPLWMPEEPPAELVQGEEPLLSSYTVVATAHGTGGALSLVDTVVPPGNGPPLHAHADADESFYVLGGSTWMSAGGRELRLEPGDYVFVPRGTPHTFKSDTDEPCRIILVYTPGGMDQFFLEIGRRAEPGEPNPRLTAEDIRRAESVAVRRFYSD